MGFIQSIFGILLAPAGVHSEDTHALKLLVEKMEIRKNDDQDHVTIVLQPSHVDLKPDEQATLFFYPDVYSDGKLMAPVTIGPDDTDLNEVLVYSSISIRLMENELHLVDGVCCFALVLDGSVLSEDDNTSCAYSNSQLLCLIQMQLWLAHQGRITGPIASVINCCS